MDSIDPRQLDTIAAFLEKSRDYLDIEHVIRLHWPLRAGNPRRNCAPARATQARRTGVPAKPAAIGMLCEVPAA